MPLFTKEDNSFNLIRPTRFQNEKELQGLVERSLGEIFNCRLVKTEFSTGAIHSGRIDSLAISEDNAPVIIEYKVVESSSIITQSLYYLYWLKDHQGDYKDAVRNALPKEDIQIDWSNIRVICIAPEYKKYDILAVNVMGANIELWQYRYFENGMFYLEEIFRKASTHALMSSSSQQNNLTASPSKEKDEVKVTYSVEEHIDKSNPNMRQLIQEVRDYILGLDEAIEEIPKQKYIAYKVSKNFVCMEIHKKDITLYLKIDPTTLESMPNIGRDVSNIGHSGTGEFELRLTNAADFEIAKDFIVTAFFNSGGN